jgi:F420H(2)-dependent biliverdin reductase
MANSTARLTNDALAFLTERHLAMLTTLRADNTPHVVAVGFTFDPKTHIARVITTGGSQKAVNAQRGGVAVRRHRQLVERAQSAVSAIMGVLTRCEI